MSMPLDCLDNQDPLEMGDAAHVDVGTSLDLNTSSGGSGSVGKS